MLDQNQLTNNINAWLLDRNFLSGATTEGQIDKLREEVEEFVDAFFDGNKTEMKDAIGDIRVVLQALCMTEGLDFDLCCNKAYNEIKHRTGTMTNGVFVKD